ncbi:amino acid ABC transporter substrate-binding protein [Roseateles sp. DAIF2]|uniref:substrate-binding periplasmic protein n=1 Tax=Roseateles sp. DAIF2 TaxID=2714952 RepID=UPI0018A2621C|nr:transporter substrate-binding domain-containing protein [Roseateles sp. DAIF2]QPF71640.1 amino acid ABC transporter substrate-binding protein [Roseateles sp. DAIF2]
MSWLSRPFLRRLLCCGLLAWLPLAAAAATAGAAPRLLGFTENLAPLNYEEAGRAQGFSSELARLMAAEAGLPIEIRVLPWQRAVQTAATAAQPSQPSLLFSLTRTPEREAQYQWVGPISPRRILVYRLSAREDLQPAGLQALGALRVGVVRESAAARRLLQAEGLDAAQLEWALDDAANLRKLLAGRMDLIVMLDWAAAWHLRQLRLPLNTLAPALPLDVTRAYWFGLPPDCDPALVRRLQEALDRVKRDGRYERLRQRYLG